MRQAALLLAAVSLAAARPGFAGSPRSFDDLERVQRLGESPSGENLEAALGRFWDNSKTLGGLTVAATGGGGPRPAALAQLAPPDAAKPSPAEPHMRSNPLSDAPPPAARSAILIGNNWEGTADIIDARTFQKIKRLDVVPDRKERLAEIQSSPVRSAYLRLIRRFAGEGHDQLVDDMFSSSDGRVLYVSRPSLADAVAIEVATGRILWRTKLEGHRSDHAALSPDGKTLLVSASTARAVQAIDTATGQIIGRFESGDTPHENNYSPDGTRIFHASIGRVFIPTTAGWLDWLKGDRYFQIVDAASMKVLKRIDMAEKLKEAGISGAGSAVRPMALAPDGRYVYLQLSFLHGFVEYDLEEDRITRIARLPAAQGTQGKYVLDSAHHGIAFNGDGTKLCVAATVSGYAAIVDRKTFTYTTIPLGERPYWATASADGLNCYVSVAGANRVSVISFKEEREIASIPVGEHPQRVRTGEVRIE